MAIEVKNQQTSESSQYKEKPCPDCGAPIVYPAQFSDSVCVPCRNCGHRGCS